VTPGVTGVDGTVTAFGTSSSGAGRFVVLGRGADGCDAGVDVACVG
jgi:hypothetical protein